MTPNGYLTVESLRQARKKKLVITVLTVYADESHDKKCEHIFAVAGIMGTQEDWDALEVDWVATTEGKIFHATDCESGYKDYKDIPKDQRLKEYKDLTQLLVRSKMSGYGAVVNIAEYKNTTLHDLKDASYFHCFMSVIFYFVKLTRNIIPQQKVKYIFDINHEIEYNAANLYANYLVKRSEYKEYNSYMEKELGFATREIVGIQAADLFSHEAMKYYDNIYFSSIKLNTRQSVNALKNTGRFELNYYGKNYFEGVENKHKDDLRNYRKEYKEWLSKNKCNDNADNRIRYLIYLELMKELGP